MHFYPMSPCGSHRWRSRWGVGCRWAAILSFIKYSSVFDHSDCPWYRWLYKYCSYNAASVQLSLEWAFFHVCLRRSRHGRGTVQRLVGWWNMLLFWNVLELWKSFKGGSFSSLLTSCISIVHLSELRSQPWYVTRNQTPDIIWISRVFPLMSFFYYIGLWNY